MCGYYLDAGMVCYIFRGNFGSYISGDIVQNTRGRGLVDVILSFSDRMIMGYFRRPLFDRNGFAVGQKSLDLGLPAHLSKK